MVHTRIPPKLLGALSAPLHSRRTALLSIAATVAAAACGNGAGSGGEPSPPPVPPPPDLPARLTLDGSSMLAPGGVPVVLRGMNEGTWGTMQSYDAAAIAAQGGNVVRVLIRWWGRYGNATTDSRNDASAGHFDPAHLTQFLKEVQWCIDAGLWVVPVLESDCGQNGLQDAGTIAYCDPSNTYPLGHNFWTDASQRQLYIEAWVYLARILKDYQKIAFYELLPEPLGGRDASYSGAVSAFYQELMVAIEDTAGDKRTPFLVGARDSYNIRLCDEAYIPTPRWANRVVYTGNLFVFTGNTQSDNISSLEQRLGALSVMKTTRNVPVFIQQFGVKTGNDLAPPNFYLEAGLSRMNAAGIGYTGWQWRQNTTNVSEYAVVIRDPVTGVDSIKDSVLAMYSKYWKA